MSLLRKFGPAAGALTMAIVGVLLGDIPKLLLWCAAAVMGSLWLLSLEPIHGRTSAFRERRPLVSLIVFVAIGIVVGGVLGGVVWWLQKPVSAITPSKQSELSTAAATAAPEQRFIPLKVSVHTVTAQGAYTKNTTIAGIKWKPEYTDARFEIINPGDMDYTNVDILFRTNQSIAEMGQYSNYPDVSLMRNAGLPRVFLDETGKDGKPVKHALAPAQITSSDHRIYCGRILSHSTVEIVLAIAHSQPPYNLMILQGSYQANGQRHSITDTANRVGIKPGAPS